jgi:hypothetical protein
MKQTTTSPFIRDKLQFCESCLLRSVARVSLPRRKNSVYTGMIFLDLCTFLLWTSASFCATKRAALPTWIPSLSQDGARLPSYVHRRFLCPPKLPGPNKPPPRNKWCLLKHAYRRLIGCARFSICIVKRGPCNRRPKRHLPHEPRICADHAVLKQTIG